MRCVGGFSVLLLVLTLRDPRSASAADEDRARAMIALQARVVRVSNFIDDGSLWGYGTGVLVTSSADYAVVATCFHVVMGAHKVTIWKRGMQQETEVLGFADYPDHDVTFLKVAAGTWPQSIGYWDVRFVDGTPSSSYASLALGKGFAEGWSLGNASSLKEIFFSDAPLATLQDLLKVLPGNVGQGNLTHLIDLSVQSQLAAGDSGGPIVASGKLVGLAGGIVWDTRQTRVVPLRYYGVPFQATDTIPQVFSSAPKAGVPPYGSGPQAVAARLSARDAFIGPLVSDSTASVCIQAVTDAVNAVPGERELLPTALDGVPDACNTFYKKLRPQLIAEGEAHRAEVAAEATAMLASAVQDVAASSVQKAAEVLEQDDKATRARRASSYKLACEQMNRLRVGLLDTAAPNCAAEAQKYAVKPTDILQDRDVIRANVATNWTAGNTLDDARAVGLFQGMKPVLAELDQRRNTVSVPIGAAVADRNAALNEVFAGAPTDPAGFARAVGAATILRPTAKVSEALTTAVLAERRIAASAKAQQDALWRDYLASVPVEHP